MPLSYGLVPYLSKKLSKFPYPGHSLGGGLTPLQRSSQCILQPQLTGQINFCFDIIKAYSISDNKSPQVSRTLLSILANLNNVVVWIVATCPLISISSSPYINPLVTAPNTPISIGITVIFKLHSFFSSLARSRYLSFFSPSFSFTQWSAGRFSVFFCWLSLSQVIWLRLGDLLISQNPRFIYHHYYNYKKRY